MIPLVKLHGLGNDFLVAFGAGGAGLARAACDRHTGIGADGLIQGGRQANGDLTFRLWNADGSEAEMSGNGMRCLAHAALDEGWVTENTPFGALTAAGRRLVTVRHTAPGHTWATVDMGPVKVGTDSASVCNVGDGAVMVDVGNPHLVVLGPDPAHVDVGRLGPELERSDPAGLNVEFVTLGPGPDSITMRVWERGVGETQACGTGSCAAAAALHHAGRVGRAVTVHQPGGSVAVELRPDGTATLAGPSIRIADCSFRGADPGGDRR
ncbi:MAG TPA: diaminopimelate epimerase [Acidimicrobiales bacterium]|jgi:diaminopimelate epimerase|nr:diaminopimelate epimerase [Acidimicrobiales bacterium]